MSRADAAARAIGERAATAAAIRIEAAARAAFPGLAIGREGADVWIAGRRLGRLMLTEPALAFPALLAEDAR